MTTNIRRTPDASREREINQALRHRAGRSTSNVEVLTGSDGRCVVTLTMDEFDALVRRAAGNTGYSLRDIERAREQGYNAGKSDGAATARKKKRDAAATTRKKKRDAA
jgi:general stress protein YciG